MNGENFFDKDVAGVAGINASADTCAVLKSYLRSLLHACVCQHCIAHQNSHRTVPTSALATLSIKWISGDPEKNWIAESRRTRCERRNIGLAYRSADRIQQRRTLDIAVAESRMCNGAHSRSDMI
jgi:hypothetical protein